MLKKTLLPVIFLVLAWGFWVSPEFKEIAAGVAIFLFGMMALEEGFKAFTGGVLEKILTASTNRVWKSLGFGMIATTLMQSSSLVSVLTISFLSAGLIALAPGIGIIFGANIGTTTGAWLVAGIGLKIDIAAYAMPMIVFGVILVFQKSKALKGAGYILAGIGFLFLGIHYMKTGFETFQDSIDLSQFSMTGYAGVLVYTLIGIVATVVMQSSHATLILGIAALAAGQITYENSLAIAIGSNVGTTITAVLGALSANAAGKRLAGAHLIFNFSTGILAILFISQLAWAVDGISSGLGIAQDNYTLKFAVFHTLFNVIGVALTTPFIGKLVTLLEGLIPEKLPDVSQPRYLNEAALELPDTALKAIFREAQHFYDNAEDYMCQGLGLRTADVRSDEEIAVLVEASRINPELDLEDLYQRRVKNLYSAIIGFAVKAESEMTPEQIEVLTNLTGAIRDVVQAVKDVKHLHKNMARYTVSDNNDIRAQYNAMRGQIAQVLRTMDRLQVDKEGTVQKLEQLKSELRETDIVDSGALDQLIRTNRISSEMASSLINDSGYAQNIGHKLINVGQAVSHDRTYDLLTTLAESQEADNADESISGRSARAGREVA